MHIIPLKGWLALYTKEVAKIIIMSCLGDPYWMKRTEFPWAMVSSKLLLVFIKFVFKYIVKGFWSDISKTEYAFQKGRTICLPLKKTFIHTFHYHLTSHFMLLAPFRTLTSSSAEKSQPALEILILVCGAWLIVGSQYVFSMCWLYGVKGERYVEKNKEGEIDNLIHCKGNAVYFIFCFMLFSDLNMNLELL